jgi:nitrate/TMAO reductase-like tetraheme cytochrome c subunit
MNQLRIESQHATNQYNKQRTLRSIDHARTTVYTNSTNSRENMNAFLRTNYEKFFSERSEEQKFKAHRAAQMYNERMEAQR